MSAPLVSVIIPAYNHERFVGAAVESVLGQSCADLELIVIDDGSRDRTGEVVQSYTDPRLSYYHQENQDAYNTINRGLGLARGEYTAILNSDDVYALNRLQRLVECRDETGPNACSPMSSRSPTRVRNLPTRPSAGTCGTVRTGRSTGSAAISTPPS